MKRKALLIGNSNGLAGVKLDISNMSSFLTSDRGGAWNSSEIVVLMNPTKIELAAAIKKVKEERPDFSVVLFSGHGGYRKQTVLELNKDGETVEESLLLNIAQRQITILDCCRSVIQTVAKALDSVSFAALRESYNPVRERYDQRIMQAIPQQVQLYGCSVGQASYDTSNGAVYLNNFLAAAKAIDTSSSSKTVGMAHAEAAELTKKQKDQTPDSVLPKCLTSQQLIIAIK
ncbi:MAG: hypothetical protein B7X50_05120 [Alishewanella sp. 34-51-39]|nr:MAG: hypothetical protein B7X50_05120 [Alishewanella sp. 34-51-39]